MLGMDFTSMNFVGVIWTREGTRKMIRSNRSTVMELPDMTSGIPLVLAHSIKIQPGGNLEVLLECTRQLTNQMNIRIDTGFHHKNPNIYIPPSCINNPNNQYNPKYMPLTIFNLSRVYHLYIGCKVPFSGNCAKVLISIYATFSCLFLLRWCINIYIARLWGMLQECTLGSSRVLHFYQHKIYNYNTCSCCTS